MVVLGAQGSQSQAGPEGSQQGQGNQGQVPGACGAGATLGTPGGHRRDRRSALSSGSALRVAATPALSRRWGRCGGKTQLSRGAGRRGPWGLTLFCPLGWLPVRVHRALGELERPVS